MITYVDSRVDLLPVQNAVLDYSRMMRADIVSCKNFLWRAGARGGKTYGSSFAAFDDAISMTGGGDYLVIAPTWAKCQEVVKPAFLHWASPYCIRIQDRFAWLKNGIRVCFLGAHNPAAIDGFTARGGWGDEIKDWKQLAFKKACERTLTTRGRWLFSTTPEGYNWIYDEFEGDNVGKPGYRKTLNSTTYDGAVLASDVDDLAATMDEKMYNQQILGLYTQFSGQVHYNFDRLENVRQKVVIGNMVQEVKYEPRRGVVALFMDFNLDPMAGGLGQVEIINGQPYVFIFDEIQIPDSNTEEFLDEVENRLNQHGILKSQVIVYPDPAGGAGHTSTKRGRTNFKIIKDIYKFKMKAKRAHPAVVDRINSVNRLIRDKQGVRHIYINPKCKNMIKYFVRHRYKKDTNIPDKGQGIEHIGDGFGYWIDYELPISYKVDTGKRRSRLIYSP